MSLAALMFLVSSVIQAADPPARATVELSPKDGAWVGQRVTLVITLATPDLFAGAPSFDLPSIPGVVVLPPSGSPTLGSESIGDDTFTTQRHEFAVYAQRAGTVQIPSFVVRFDSNAGYGKPTIARRVVIDPVSFRAKTPPGAERLGTVIATRHLTLVDEWTPEPKSAKVGDAFTRTVTINADDVPGMIFPPFRLDEVDGLAAYPKESAVNDQVDRGRLRGERSEAVTYVCKAPGSVALPGRSLTWYDLAANELKTVRLPGRSFTIAEAPNRGSVADSPADEPGEASGRWDWKKTALIGLVLAVSPILVTRFGKRFASWCKGRLESEPADFARLRRACRGNDPQAAYDALLRWLDRCGLPALDDLERRADDPELTRAIAALEDRVDRPSGAVDPGPHWSGAPLLDRLTSARRRFQNSTTGRDVGHLPPLNPTG